ncbi:cadherin-like beta sandwich domain-containing protein, partial [Paenibacillus daejeonensis]|uniref:cadherin-like beta sandwich domain-containing protein n=1 Tax=Paenibacillus daejeonensis TaxID=135193 RepID=UPI00146B8BAE
MVLQRIVPKFILFLVFLLVVSVATPGQPVLADNFGDYTYTNHGDGTVTITDYNGTATDVNIPGTLNGLTVIGIGMDAFRSNALTSVTIPDGVRTIGAQAFLYNNLTSVTIPGSVTSIGDHAFRQSGLRSVTLSDGVTTIGAAAFSENDLSSVTIPGSVTTIGDQAFRDNSLTSVTILNGVQTIGNYAFILNSVSSVTIPGSVTSIGEHAFRDNSLTSVTIPDGVTTIGVSAFYNNSLTSVTLPDSLTSIGNSAFMNNSLTSVTIPDSSMTIGNGAFQANALRSIAIPDSIPEIGEYAFSYNQLSSVRINGSDTIIGAHAFEGNQPSSADLTLISFDPSTAKDYAADYGHTFNAFADLTSLTLSAGSLDPAFASDTEEYTASVANSVNTIEVTPTTAVGTSTVTVNGDTVTSGNASDPIALNVGANTITLVVTPQNGSTKTYTVEVTRAASSNANLSDLTLSAGSLDPVFASGTEEYTASVANSVNEIEVTPTVDAGTSTVTVNGGTVTTGSASDPIALNVGANTITVEVTAQDNSTKTYTIEVTRAASSNANLSDLTLSAGSLDPAFASGTEAYTASVANSVNEIEVTPTTAVGTSTVAVNGATVTSGSASDPIALIVGANTITVEVTAQDNSTKTYTIEVTRAASSNANLSGLTLSAGSLDPAFASGTEDYTASVANSVNNIEVTPTTAVGTSTVTVNGGTVTSGSASDPIALNVGVNTITVEVTAQDNSTKTYTVEVTRAASSNANLSGLTL